jgi:hypothetical protein
VEPCRLIGEPIAFDVHREARLSASLVLCLFDLTCLWAGFAERFDHGFYVDAFPERLLTDYMLVPVMLAAQWDYSPIIWLLSHPCTTTIANVSAFNRHLLAVVYTAMERSNEV